MTKKMSANTPKDFPYKTYVNILHGPLELIDLQKLADACKDKWYNQTLCQVNDSVVRLGVLEGEYHWHEHTDIDEFFFVLDGTFLIDLEDKTIELAPRQGFVVPKGVRHRTRAPQRCVPADRLELIARRLMLRSSSESPAEDGVPPDASTNPAKFRIAIR